MDTGGVAAAIDLYIDGASSPSQTLSVNTTASTRQQALTLTSGLVGKKARLAFTPGANGKFQKFSHAFVTTPADKGPVVHTSDWMDLGHRWDKHIRTLNIEYEVTADTPFVVEGLSGIGSAQSVSTITTVTLKAGGRKTDQFALPANTIVKAVRVRPTTPNSAARIYRADFDPFERYPADVVYTTESTTSGTEFPKIYNQVVLQVDTGGVAASIQVEVDGSVKQTLTGITTTTTDRTRTLTLNPGIRGNRARILATPGNGGKFQLFAADFVVAPDDRGPVYHSMDWQDLGWEHSKLLKEITVEYDNNSQGSVTLTVDTLGADGVTITLNALSFTLNGIGRSKQTFPVATDTIVKMVRVHPSADFTSFKMWPPKWITTNYPPDVAYQTDWDDLGYRCEKILRNVELEIDTGGVACTVALQADGVTKQTFTVTSTANDRVRIISCDSTITNTVLIGKRFRLLFTPGTGGKAQLFRYTFGRTFEPCPSTHWDSLEMFLGSAGYRYLKQIWVEYRCLGSITISIYRDGGKLFYQKILGQHLQRDAERFYLPALSNGALNKSKSYRVMIDAVDPAKPFYLYRDSTRMETMMLSGNAREMYAQHFLWEEMPLPR